MPDGIVHDDNGNRLGKSGTTTYEYDPEGRLTEANNLVRYKYDYSGKRVLRLIPTHAMLRIDNTNPTNPEGSRYFTPEVETRNMPNQYWGRMTKHDFFGGVPEVGGEVRWQGRDAEAQRRNKVIMDHRTRCRPLWEESHAGRSAAQYIRYKPFGEERGRYNAALQPNDPMVLGKYTFTGYEQDGRTGLQYANARWYDPDLGQFGAHDPARQYANPYAYGPWDPMNGTDPSGEFWFVPAIAAAVSAFAVAHPIVTTAVVGGVTGGVNSAVTGQSIFRGVALGAGLGIVGGAAIASGSFAIGIAGGAAVGVVQSAAAGQNPLYGALIGAGFGAIGSYAGNIPAVPGDGFGAYLANAGVEIGTEAGIGALRGGFSTLANGGDFGTGAAGGAAFGASLGAANVAFLGAKTQVQFSDQLINAEFNQQSLLDRSGLKLSPPTPRTYTYRSGGLIPLLNGMLTAGTLQGRAIVVGNSMTLMPSDRADLMTLAHELRHIAQLQALGIPRFYGRYLYESATSLYRFYQRGNTTLEPYYGR